MREPLLPPKLTDDELRDMVKLLKAMVTRTHEGQHHRLNPTEIGKLERASLYLRVVIRELDPDI